MRASRSSRRGTTASRLARIAAGSTTALVALAIWPGVSSAGCGGTVTAAPSHDAVAGQLPPLAIGDSTMLLSLPGLAADGFSADARGCRQFSQAVAMLAQLRGAGRLPRMVVLALGANGTIAPAEIATALRILGRKRLLVLVTPRQLGGAAGANAALEHQQQREHPAQILLLDWVADSAGHRPWFQPDGLHLTPPGVSAFTGLLARALAFAYLIPGC